MPKKRGNGLYDCIGRLLYMVIGKMAACVECGKRLGFFEGYHHPTLGKKSLVCSPCFDKVQQSVDQWMEFVLSNSFNPESSEHTLSIDWGSLFNRISRVQKQLNRTEQQKSLQTTRCKSHKEMTLKDLNCNSDEILAQLGRTTV